MSVNEDLTDCEGMHLEPVTISAYCTMSPHSSTSVTGTTFLVNGVEKRGPKYENSLLNSECEYFYNSLPTNIKNAIIAQEIEQDMYDCSPTAGTEDFTILNTARNMETIRSRFKKVNDAPVAVGTRHAYALSAKAIKDYFGGDSATGLDVARVFRLDGRLRDACLYDDEYTCTIAGGAGAGITVDDDQRFNRWLCVYPAFHIDLTKVETLKKGDVIYIDIYNEGAPRKFRVIDVDKDNANIVKLLGLENWNTVPYNSTYQPTKFDDGSRGQQYSESRVDGTLNDGSSSYSYYGMLSQQMKDAIIAEEVTQSSYKSSVYSISGYDFTISGINGNNMTFFKRVTQKTVGSRYVHAIDLDEIKSYFLGGSASGDIRKEDLRDMFFSQAPETNTRIWCASASNDSQFNAYTAWGSPSNGGISSETATSEFTTRPVFKINLSTIEYVKEESAE